MSKVTFIWVKTLSSNSRLIFCTFSRVQSCCFVVVVFFSIIFLFIFIIFMFLNVQFVAPVLRTLYLWVLFMLWHRMDGMVWWICIVIVVRVFLYGILVFYLFSCHFGSVFFVFELTQNFRFLSVRRALCFIECTFVRKTLRTHNSYTLPIFVLRFIGFPSFWRSSGLPCYDNLNEAHRGIHIFSIRKTLYI